MLVPTLIFTVFALLSGVGVYLILAHHRSRQAGVAGAVVTFLLFVALYAGVVTLLRQGGF
jgi:hypothetical protein